MEPIITQYLWPTISAAFLSVELVTAALAVIAFDPIGTMALLEVR